MTLAVYNSAAFTSATGLAIGANATVEVRRESDNGLAAIFSDAAGASPITNPSAFADSSGRFSFYAAGLAGGYKVQVTKGAETYTLRRVAIGTAAELDVSAFYGKSSLYLSARELTPRSANGCAAIATSNGASGQPDVPYLAFDGAAKEFAQFVLKMPKAWDAGAVTFSFDWRRASGTGAADVVWGARALAVSDNDTPVANFGSDATVTSAAKTTTANFVESAETAALTVGGTPAKTDLVFFEVFRDGAAGADTLNAVDAWLSGVTLYYTTNALNDA